MNNGIKLKSSLLAQTRQHFLVDPHKRANSLADVILGGQDGLVNVLGVILGVAAATSDSYLVLVAGLAATFAESVSMGAVAFTSMLADADYYESERAREYRHIEDAPNLEIEEVREIYQSKGFEGELLEKIVHTITKDKDVWVAVMMAEEHRLTPVDRKQALRSALIVGAAAMVGSLIPLAPFAFLPVSLSAVLAVVVSAIVLFVVGFYKARVTVGSPGRSGLEMAIIGTVSALVGYGVGAVLKLPPTP